MNISAGLDSGRLTVSFEGELDHHSARQAMHTVERLIDENMPRDCELDLSGLSFMDSSGIALIIRTSERMRVLGGRAWIADPAPQAQRVIDASGIDRLVPVAISR